MRDNLSRMPLAASRDDISDIWGGITQWDSALFITDIQVISVHSEVADVCKGRYSFSLDYASV